MPQLKARTPDRVSSGRKVTDKVKAATPIGRALKAVSDMGSACPYTALSKKAINAVKGHRQEKRKVDDDKERDLLALVRMGRTIVLIGFFCPIFWFSLLSGVRGPQLRFNAMHSGLVILVGLTMMLKGWLSIKNKSDKS